MSKKETLRLLRLTEVEKEEITLKKAAELMELSYPQTKRIWSNYKKFGPKGLISKKRGVQSNRAVPNVKRKEIARIISANYQGCKPRFVSEKLNQHHNICYSSDSPRTNTSVRWNW